MEMVFDPGNPDDYARFLRVKSLPAYRIKGRSATFPDAYAALAGSAPARQPRDGYIPSLWLYDYQRDIAALAIRRRKFAVFAQCGLGKTAILTEWARHAASRLRKGHAVLVVSPLLPAAQMVEEAARFYGSSLPLELVPASRLAAWCASPTSPIGVTNYEAITDKIRRGKVGALALDESSMLKSHYGAWGRRLVDLGRGMDWKLCLTGTPAPNDRIEFAQHAVFLDRFPTVNSFLARFFVNRGETGKRWELKPHALRPFYRALSDWCIFLESPATYGWKDNAQGFPPIRVHIHDVPLTARQRELAGIDGLGGGTNGLGKRAAMARLAKGWFQGQEVESHKGEFIRALVASDASPCIVWCKYNAEQDALARLLPDAGSLDGRTPEQERRRMVAAFQGGTLDALISKPKVMGFGLNLQRCRRMVFSTIQDSYEEYWQAVKRANRVGSRHPLDVHLPLTEIERPMAENVLRKARRVEEDAREQERLFKEVGYAF